MPQRSKIFEDNYQDYCKQIAAVDLALVKDLLEIQVDNNIAQVLFFNQTYQVSGYGIFNADNEKAEYVTCVILSKYVLLCPDKLYLDPESLAMASSLLAEKLIQADKNKGDRTNGYI